MLKDMKRILAASALASRAAAASRERIRPATRGGTREGEG